MIKNLLKLNKKNLIKIFIFLSFIICWQSISTKFDDLIIKKNLFEISLFEMINFIRHFLIYSIFPILLVLNIFLFKHLKKKIELNILLLPFLFLYFFSQIPGLIFTDNSIYNISFVISSLCLILTMNIGNYYLTDSDKKIFVYISLFFLIIIFLILYPSLIKILYEGKTSFYGYFLYENPLFFNKESPRATGTSRTILLIIVFVDFICASINFKFKNYISNFVRIFGFYNLYLFQSRTALFLMIIYIIFIFFFEKKKNSFSFLKKTFLYILIPLFCSYLTFSVSAISHQKRENIPVKKDLFEYFLWKEGISNIPTRKVREGNFTSGRYNDWIELTSKLTKSPFIGHGSQADRYLINQSASNGLLYSASSSGALGTIFFIIFSFLLFLKALKNIISKKLEFRHKIISIGILMILGRSVLESSYAVFSIDLIILCTFFTLIETKNK